MAPNRRIRARREQTRQPAQAPVLDLKQARRRRKPPGQPVIARGYLILAGIFLMAVLAGVLANYYAAVKRPGDEPILRVNKRTFAWSEFVSILKSQKLGAEAFGGTFNAGVAPYQLMQTLAENELVRQAAPREGLRFTEDMIKAEMVSRLVPNASESGADKAQIERDFSAALSNYLATTQLSFSQYKSIVEADLLRNQLRDKLGAAIPRVQPQSFVHIIRIRDLQKTDQIQKGLKEGEPFSKLARQLSDDEDTKNEGGELGWTPRLALQEFDDLLFGLAAGQVSDAVQAPEGLYLARITERLDVDKARLQVILLEDAKTARDVKERIDKGASFDELAGQVSADPALRSKRGDLGVVTAGERGGVFDSALRGLPLNKVSDPLSTADGTVYLMVSNRAQAQEVAETNLGTLKTRALEAWLRREWDANSVNYCPKSEDDCFSNVKVDRALAQTGDVSRTKFEQAATATATARKRGGQSQLPFR